MGTGRLDWLLQCLRRIIHKRGDCILADGVLVERFRKDADEAAFEVLVWRHGPMVLSLCARMLGNVQDAEDAFQATFLTLARKAGSISKRESVGSWLYKVAYRIALRAKKKTSRQATNESRTIEVTATSEPAAESASQALRPLLDEAVKGLPETYRLVIVLHYLEGKSSGQIARELNCPIGTVTSRLAPARELLRREVARRGLTLSAALVSAALAQGKASSAVPPILALHTVELVKLLAAGKGAAAAIPAKIVALSEGAIKAMVMTKIKVAAALCAGSIALGCGVLLYLGAGQREPARAHGAVPIPRRLPANSQKLQIEPLLEQAMGKTATIKDDARKAYALMLLGKAQAAAGDRLAAVRTLKEAAKVAKEIPDTEQKDQPRQAFTLMLIAQGQAAVGSLQDARDTANGIFTQRMNCREMALAHIALAEARSGDIKRAVETAGRSNVALRLIAERQIEVGDYKGALMTAGLISEPGNKVEALALLAPRLAKKDGKEAGAKTLKLATDLLKELEDGNTDLNTSRKAHALVDIARAKIEMGSMNEALKLAEGLKGSSRYDCVMAQVAAVLLKEGKLEETRRIAQSIRVWPYKGDLLRDVATAQLQAGELDEARKTMALIRPSVQNAEVLLKLANYLERKGEKAAADKAFQETMNNVREPDTLWTDAWMSASPDHLYQIMAARTHAGDGAGALAWSERQESPFVQSVALAGIVEGLARRLAEIKAAPGKK